MIDTHHPYCPGPGEYGCERLCRKSRPLPELVLERRELWELTCLGVGLLDAVRENA